MFPWITLCICFSFGESVLSHYGEVIMLNEASSCGTAEYFNVHQLKCISCDSKQNLVPSTSGLECVCNERSKVVSHRRSSSPICEICGNGSVPTMDHMRCISCPASPRTSTDSEHPCETFRCPSNHIRVERWPNGTLRREVLCVECIKGTVPSPSGSECIPCIDKLTTPEQKECSCISNQSAADDSCFTSDILKDWPTEEVTFTVIFENGRKVQSQFLRENLLQAIALCKMNNFQSCQMVANLCVMTMYAEGKRSPCSMFSERKGIPVMNTGPMPWIYYGEGEASTVLGRKRISVRYNLDRKSEMSYLNLTGVFHNVDGSFMGVKRITGSMMQLCPGSWKAMDSALRFGVKYSHSCNITAQQLLKSRQMEFIDLFLHYKDSEGDVLYAIPILVKNMKKEDNLIGIRFQEGRKSPEKDAPEVVRYLKYASLNIRLQGAEDEGKIFVPHLVVEYGELTREQIENNIDVGLDFQVRYEMENSFSHTLEVCMGVFSALAVLWSSFRTWSHSKRSGRFTIDIYTLIQLILYTCGNLANIFFLIVFCASIDIFIFFKGQSALHVLLPSESQEETIRIYVILAFLLKVVEICHLIYYQISIDIFFIDWERPRARNLVPRSFSIDTQHLEVEEQQPVSIWRTYFIANEWNEIQTKRKLNINTHLLMTVLFLKCFGIENWTTADPELYLEIPSCSVGKSSSFICRFAVGGLVFLAAYISQLLFTSLIYERYIKNGIQEFVDVCSIANISVFILALENYGFYIHGRSVHGFSDTDMQNIINQLRKEEEDLVGHRGLLPGTDQQTFEMIVPVQLRSYYRKVMTPLKSVGQSVKRFISNQGTGIRVKTEMENVDQSIQAYHNMNRFLAAFLEHALKDLDYEVREKLFTESLLGMEFIESPDKGILYSDNGHSFDNVLFYGNELSLLSFDLMMFCFVEVTLHDYLIAGIVTAIVDHLMAMIRDVGGRKNLAKKTLIDERFLI